MIEFQVVDLSTLEFHVNGPINPNLATLTLRPPKTVSLCKLHPALTSARRHEPMSRVTSLGQEAVTPSLALQLIQPEHMEDRVGLFVAEYCGQLPEHGNVCRGKSLHSRVESINFVSIFYSWVCAARVRCAVAGLRCSRVGSTSWWGGVPFPGAGRLVATTINDAATMVLC